MGSTLPVGAVVFGETQRPESHTRSPLQSVSFAHPEALGSGSRGNGSEASERLAEGWGEGCSSTAGSVASLADDVPSPIDGRAKRNPPRQAIVATAAKRILPGQHLCWSDREASGVDEASARMVFIFASGFVRLECRASSPRHGEDMVRDRAWLYVEPRRGGRLAAFTGLFRSEGSTCNGANLAVAAS